MRKEIEVKARVGDLAGIAQKLEKLGCIFSKPMVQRDTVFVDAAYGTFETFQPGKNLLRIRETEEGVVFTVKQPQTNELDSIEYETEIQSAEEMKKALSLMGYREIVAVRKTRQRVKYKEWEICLDEVDGLGSFVEVEKIVSEGDAKTIQNTMYNFLTSIGVAPEDRVTHGYDTLVYLKKH